MKIWIDGQAFQSPSRFRGIGRYILELLKAIQKNNPEITLFMSFNAAMPEELVIAKDIVKNLILEENIFLWEGVANSGEGVEGYSDKIKLNERLLAYHVAQIDPDIAMSVSPFEGGNNYCTPLTGKFGHEFKIVSIFYDAIPYRYPELYLANDKALAYYERRLFAHRDFDLNLSISNFSDSELRDILNTQNSVPIFAGLSENFLNLKRKTYTNDTPPTLDHIKIPYLLYVGELDWRKNYLSISDAMHLCNKKIKDNTQLIIAGGNYGPGIKKLKESWQINELDPDNLVFLGHVSDEELVWLYQNAKAVIQPSLMEGFGLTALESVACGTPVFVANAGALPEVVRCEEAMFSPMAPDELTKLIEKLFDDPNFGDELIQKSKKSLKDYNWDRSAKLAVDAMLDLISVSVDNRPRRKNTNDVAIKSMESINIDPEEIAHGLAAAIPTVSNGSERIFVDATSTARIERRTGIQRVVFSICDSLAKDKALKNKLTLVKCDSHDGFFPVKIDRLGQFKPKKPLFAQPTNFSFSKNDTIVMLDGSWDYLRFHESHLRDAYLRGADVVTVLYDLVPMRCPAFCLTGVPEVYNEWLKEALTYSTGVMCISKAVADELILLLEGIDFPRKLKIGYWHLGADFSSIPRSKNRQHKRSQKNSFLMVGTIEPRKGYSVALDAFDRMWKDGLDVNLTIVGKEGWKTSHITKRINEHPEFDRKLLWKKNVDDDELCGLYENSDALVCTSYVEGFGLPLVEAAHFTKPTIASDIDVFKEIAISETTTYFETGSAQSLEKIIREFMEKPVDEGNATDFPTPLSWKSSAKSLLNNIQTDSWYKTYSPRRASLSADGRIGNIFCEDVIKIKSSELDISLVDKPTISNDSRFYVGDIKVLNKSKFVWSSVGPAQNAHLGVFLGARYLDENGQLNDFDGNRTEIPFTIVPGLEYFMTIKLEREQYEANTQFDIEFVQEGVAWWGNGLKIQKSNLPQTY